MPPASARVFPAGDILPPVQGKTPLELYKYVSVESALYTLLIGNVYFSNVRNFNDPFDGKPIVRLNSRKDEKEAIAHVRPFIQEMKNKFQRFGIASNEEISALFNPENILYLPRAVEILNRVFSRMDEKQNIGVFCMSENYDSFPMWAHYADGHAGCCLKFDLSVRLKKCDWRKCFPFVWLGKIEYGEQSPKFPDTKLILPHAPGSAYMSKSRAWEYEGEWRAVVYDSSVKSPSTGKSITDGMYPDIARKMEGGGEYPLQKGLLTGVILGHKMKESDIKSVTAAARFARLEVYEAEIEQSDYGMTIKRYVPPTKRKRRGKGG